MKAKLAKDHPTLPLRHSDSERSRQGWEEFFSRNKRAKAKRKARRK